MAKKDINYLDLVPQKNPACPYVTGDDGIVVVDKEWTGFYHKIAQKFFHRPRVSHIKLDEYGSFIWQQIDGIRNVYEISELFSKHEPNAEKSLSRVIKFMTILKEHEFILWKEDKNA